MKKILLTLSVLAVALSSCISAIDATNMDMIPTDGINSNYVTAQQPLQPQALVALPSGTVKPEGWIKTLAELQRDGLNGQLLNISAWLQKEDNAWLTTGGKWGWEEVPYWLRGYAELAYNLDDENMLNETKFWIEAIIKSQRENGDIGPHNVDGNGNQDFWPNMLIMWILQSYYEYTGDSRIIDCMTKYFEYQLSVPDENFLKSYWQNSRGGDNLWSVYWLYNKTGNKNLLALAEKLHRCTADWTQNASFPNWHNVNIAQGIREPALNYMFTGNKDMLRAAYNVHKLVRQAYGQVPGGMFSADENARIAQVDPRQGVEVCGMAEQMCTNEMMLLFNSDKFWAENTEDVFFNSYFSAFSEDLKGLRYFTCPNLVISDTINHSPGIQNNGPFLCINPFSSRCCQHNHGFTIPYYINHLLYATPDNGIASVLFNSCKADVLVADGKKVNVNVTTDYPFDENIVYDLSIEGDPVNFPFYVRIPSWTKNPTVKVNGKNVQAVPGKYLRIARAWANGDKIEATFPMYISSRTWQANKNSVSVDYGPLTLSLKIQEKYEKVPAKSNATGDSQWSEGMVDLKNWPAYNITPQSAWNYALNPSTVVLKSKKQLQKGVNPFSQENVNLLFTAKGRQVPGWKIDKYNLCDVLPYPEDEMSSTEDEIELVPMGACRLRISAFPQYK